MYTQKNDVTNEKNKLSLTFLCVLDGVQILGINSVQQTNQQNSIPAKHSKKN